MTSPIERVRALCDEWDALSKGETATTRRIREALAPLPSDGLVPLIEPHLTDEEVKMIVEQLKNPARIFILPNDEAEFTILEVDTDQLTLWGDEPCV